MALRAFSDTGRRRCSDPRGVIQQRPAAIPPIHISAALGER